MVSFSLLAQKKWRPPWQLGLVNSLVMSVFMRENLKTRYTLLKMIYGNTL
jgi:hypothetical protein